MAVQPEYNIWIRATVPDLLYSLYDYTQFRGRPPAQSAYRPWNSFNDLAYNRAHPPIQGPPGPPDRNIYSRLERGFRRVTLITDYESLKFKTKYNNVGGWALRMRDNTAEAEILKSFCYGSTVDDGSRPPGYDGILVIRNGKIIFSGSVHGFSATGDYYAEQGPMIEFWGPDDNIYLEERVCMVPSPGNEIAPSGHPPYSTPPTVPGQRPPAPRYWSGSQNFGTGANFEGSFSSPFYQGWGYNIYPVSSQSPKRSVSTVLREIVRNNVGPYAIFPNTYPFFYIVPPNPRFNVNTINPPVYNSTDDTDFYTSRRIPFLFMGQANDPINAYTNNLDSNRLENQGPDYVVRARYQTLLSKCQEIGTYAVEPSFDPRTPLPAYRGYQFQIIQDDIQVSEYVNAANYNKITTIDGLRFNYKEPRTETQSRILFSESIGNIGSYKYEFTQPTVTCSIVGGQGSERFRWFVTRLSTTEIYGLREKFKDRRDIQYGDTGPPNTLPYFGPGFTPIQQSNAIRMIEELEGAADVELREYGSTTILEIEVLNVAPTIYFEDYFIGDYVTIRLADQDIFGQVTEVEVTITKDEGEIVKPSFGNQVIGDRLLLFNSLRQTRQGIIHLDTSY